MAPRYSLFLCICHYSAFPSPCTRTISSPESSAGGLYGRYVACGVLCRPGTAENRPPGAIEVEKASFHSDFPSLSSCLSLCPPAAEGLVLATGYKSASTAYGGAFLSLRYRSDLRRTAKSEKRVSRESMSSRIELIHEVDGIHAVQVGCVHL